MKNTSIFIPLLLIGCLAALIYLFFAALSASEEGEVRTPDKIVLNEKDYRAPGTATTDESATLNARNGEADTDAATTDDTDFGDYFQEVPEEEKVTSPATTTSVPTATRSTSTTTPRAAATTPPTRPATQQNGRYLVIAGTFAQAANAKERVNSLRAAGFTDTRAESFNRGTYSVALAGQYDRYSSAQALADKISRRGFEVRVMKRR